MVEVGPWLALLLLAPLPWLAKGDAARRGWGIAAVATLALFIGLRSLPGMLPGDRWLGDQWDWAGPSLALAGVAMVAALLFRRGLLDRFDCGLTLAQAPGSMTPALLLAAGTLAIHYATMAMSPFRLPGVPLETWLYQATLPGLVEEPVFRGLLLAMADRAVSPRHGRWDVMGARIGWGGLLVTLAFVALHGLSLGVLLGVLPAAFLYLWLRVRTGSLLLPIVVHNLWNLSLYAAHS